ncbi:MAG TPA: 6-bladed beta-propeller [Bacteroidales bacterium]|nr:6-bladed beta-propeller [Bacteroidales bacterium]
MKALSFVFLMILAASCKSPDNNIYTFDPRRIKADPLFLSDIASDIRYVQLDDTIPIKYVTWFRFRNGIFYIPNKKLGLLTYSRDGKFIKTIGKVGRGPGEYVNCDLFYVDKNSRIYILDIDQKVKIFSANGDYEKCISLDEYGGLSHIYVNDSKLFLFEFLSMGKAEYNWIVMDTLGNVLHKKRNTIPPFYNTMVGGGGVFEFDNILSYWNYINDSVFTISADSKYQTSILISPGNHRLPRMNIDFEKFPQYLRFFQIFETRKFLVFQYELKGQQTMMLVNKKNKKSYSTDFNFKKGYYSCGLNDFDGGFMVIPLDYYSHEDKEYIIGVIEPSQLKALMGRDEFINFEPKYPDKKNELEKLARDADQYGNPIMMVVELK